MNYSSGMDVDESIVYKGKWDKENNYQHYYVKHTAYKGKQIPLEMFWKDAAKLEGKKIYVNIGWRNIDGPLVAYPIYFPC